MAREAEHQEKLHSAKRTQAQKISVIGRRENRVGLQEQEINS